jgi:hypothetical protein
MPSAVTKMPQAPLLTSTTRSQAKQAARIECSGIDRHAIAPVWRHDRKLHSLQLTYQRFYRHVVTATFAARTLTELCKGEAHTAERCDATARHFPFCLMKVSVKIIVAVSGCPLKFPACEALPVTTAASP